MYDWGEPSSTKKRSDRSPLLVEFEHYYRRKHRPPTPPRPVSPPASWESEPISQRQRSLSPRPRTPVDEIPATDHPRDHFEDKPQNYHRRTSVEERPPIHYHRRACEEEGSHIHHRRAREEERSPPHHRRAREEERSPSHHRQGHHQPRDHHPRGHQSRVTQRQDRSDPRLWDCDPPTKRGDFFSPRSPTRSPMEEAEWDETERNSIGFSRVLCLQNFSPEARNYYIKQRLSEEYPFANFVLLGIQGEDREAFVHFATSREAYEALEKSIDLSIHGQQPFVFEATDYPPELTPPKRRAEVERKVKKEGEELPHSSSRSSGDNMEGDMRRMWRQRDGCYRPRPPPEYRRDECATCYDYDEPRPRRKEHYHPSHPEGYYHPHPYRPYYEPPYNRHCSGDFFEKKRRGSSSRSYSGDHPPPLPPRNEHPTQTIYVGNLHPETSPEELRSLFRPFGEIEEVRMKVGTKGPNPFAFIRFTTLDAAKQAKEEMAGTRIGHQAIKTGYSLKLTQSRVKLSGLHVSATFEKIRHELDLFGQIQDMDFEEGATELYVTYWTEEAAIDLVEHLNSNPFLPTGEKVRARLATPVCLPEYTTEDYQREEKKPKRRISAPVKSPIEDKKV